jgi:8-hydroxy-5-deazaflavin:NADPH oxidoreductase
MKIAVLGTGAVGRTMATGLADAGHSVVIGTRAPEAPSEPFAAWLGRHPAMRAATFADAASDGELIVNATSGAGSLPALTLAGAANLAGKVVMDLANPLEFSGDGLPSLFVANTDSLAEQLQRAFPDARVVKALNTMTAPLMVAPARVGDGDHTSFVAGDDRGAKEQVSSLLADLGHADIIDLGDLSAARGCEMFLALWLSTSQALGTPMFNIKVVR